MTRVILRRHTALVVTAPTIRQTIKRDHGNM
jgi:hypothetical protein